ncbi:hypothetical protein [Natrinema salinisoli]|nr:hypothetical protein [Natrinema salinisoli]
MSLWRGSTLTDRGRLQEKNDDDREDEDAGDSGLTQADLSQWSG